MKFLKRLAASVAAGRRERETAEELETHISLLAEENVRRGMGEAAAWRAARLTFGSVEAAREHCREQQRLAWAENLALDLRYALRGFRRNPVFTAVALACFTLGIGANTAVFSLFNAVMLRGLPVEEPSRLVFFEYTKGNRDIGPMRRLSSGYSFSALPYCAYEALRRAKTLDGVFVFVPPGVEGSSLTVTVDGRAAAVDGEMVTGEYFSALGVRPALGRALVDSDLRADAPDVAVVSHGFWTRELNADPGAVGRRMTINGQLFKIAGVAPEGFAGLLRAKADLWVPLRPTASLRPWGSRSKPAQAPFTDNTWWWTTIGARLKPGVTREQARAETEPLFQQAITAGVTKLPTPLPGLELSAAGPVFENYRKRYALSLRILLLTSGLVLLIACSNLAALMAARVRARRKETAIRLSIGASRGRIAAQFLTETLLLSAAGGALGLWLATWLGPALLSLLAGSGRETQMDVSPDWTVLAFTMGLSVGTGVACGLLPAWRAAREDLAPRLKPAGVSSRWLVAAQVALSVVLLYGAGLFLRTLRNLDAQALGFERESLLLFDIDPERSGYQGQAGVALHARLLEAVQAVPGVRAATVSEFVLLSGWSNTSPSATDGPQPKGPNEVHYNRVGPNFFETMGMRLVLGRGVTAADITGSRPVAVVNQKWAEAFFPGQNPVGHRLSLGDERLNPEKAYEIVGLAADAKFERMRETPPRTVFLSYGAKWDRSRRLSYAVRARASVLPAVFEAVRTVDANLPLFNLKTQEQQIEEALGQERLLARVSAFFGGLALLLVAVGIYGTLSFAVTQRTAEIGVRMALGARAGDVVRMVLRESFAVAAAGLACGVPAALGLSRLVEASLYGVKPHDAATLTVVGGVLALIATLSGLAPASRAARIDPLRALRIDG